jgi:hypothetical protein
MQQALSARDDNALVLFLAYTTAGLWAVLPGASELFA